MEEKRLEIKVGLLFVAAALGCVGLLYLMGIFDPGGRSTVFVDFGHSGGIPSGAPTKLAGVRVGRVAAVALFPSRKDDKGEPLPVRMTVEIEEEYFERLTTDASFVVATQGPLGEPFLEIIPGAGAAPLIKDDDVLRGSDPPRIDLLMPKLVTFLDAANGLLAEEQGVRTLLRNAASLSEQAQTVLSENGPVLSQAIRDLSDAARDLKALSATASATLNDGDTKRIVANIGALSEQLRRDLPGITAKAQKAADGAALLTESITPEDVARIKSAIAHYEDAGRSLGSVAERADRLLDRLEKGEGTAGALAQDPQLYEDLKALVTDLKRHPWKLLWKD